MICVCFLLPSRGGAMIASRDSFPSEPRRACRRGVNHRFDFIERHDLICRMLGAQCPAGRFLNLLWFGRRITSGRVGRRNHWHPRQRRSWSFCKTFGLPDRFLFFLTLLTIFSGVSLANRLAHGERSPRSRKDQQSAPSCGRSVQAKAAAHACRRTTICPE